MKTAVIIGNGESLNETPLEELAKRYDTFGCNRIHLLPFSPKYYVRVEPPQWNGTSEDFFNECLFHIWKMENCIFPDWREELGNHENVEWINTCHHYKYKHTDRKFPQHWHLPFICDVNVIIAMMQIAVVKGYQRLILVGCDLEKKHFSSQDNGLVETERLLKLHEIASRECPVQVLNATIGGVLEAYERINVHDVTAGILESTN